MSKEDQEYVYKFKLYMALQGISLKEYCIAGMGLRCHDCVLNDPDVCKSKKTLCINPDGEITSVKFYISNRDKDRSRWRCIEWIKYV